ncbi:DNA alkylation repair protein [Mucilaginibacter sp. RS28]|uniref:DNA alkylation repair protein n=1 Tax=Mucilaginibacter straminoryzae TaxID=2932774 RepID=A0A9X1X528_9SPHI|nr:DNA alkylation repair protein [Mucilaginibacter straminoryzae]MCJ8211088.1 DNA alkylation repair protein [Mucilaginibacter straminoryzae]
MTVAEIMTILESHADEGIKKILLKHGVKEPFFGVKIEHLKPIQKQIRKDYQLAKDLYATGNSDAMYLAGLIADDERMTPDDLQLWAEQALSQNICEYTVPWVAAGSKHGFDMARKWIEDPRPHVAAAGWGTWSCLFALKPDDEIDFDEVRTLLKRIAQTISQSPTRVVSRMNNFIISAGTYLTPLTEDAIATATSIGKVITDMHGTSCKVPYAPDYINKVKDRGNLGKKKKTVKC